MKRLLVRSNGERLEVREVSEPIMIFDAPRKNKYPLPCIDEIWDDGTAREYIRDLLREKRYVRKL